LLALDASHCADRLTVTAAVMSVDGNTTPAIATPAVAAAP